MHRDERDAGGRVAGGAVRGVAGGSGRGRGEGAGGDQLGRRHPLQQAAAAAL